MGERVECCNCHRAVGREAKVQPMRVTSADGKGKEEIFCARCFVWLRMLREPERFNASHVVVARCQFCHFEMISNGADDSGYMCSHCEARGAMPIRPSEQDLNDIMKAVRIAAEMHNDGEKPAKPFRAPARS